MSKLIHAHTNLESSPGYINFTRENDGSVTVYFRGDPTTVEGGYVCGHAADKWKPGHCTPGDTHCNNYCNMAPEKGPMKPAPLPCVIVREGASAKLTLAAADFDALAAALRGG